MASHGLPAYTRFTAAYLLWLADQGGFMFRYFPIKRLCVKLACAMSLSWAGFLPATAQTSTMPAATSSGLDQCILAGRLDDQQRWAPQARGVLLLNAAGQPVINASKEALATVKAVRLSQPALLSSCQGNQTLPSGGDTAGKKTPTPAVAASTTPISVQAITYPPLRVGGELVELKLELQNARLIQLTR
jgi:hypothetical protein